MLASPFFNLFSKQLGRRCEKSASLPNLPIPGPECAGWAFLWQSYWLCAAAGIIQNYNSALQPDPMLGSESLAVRYQQTYTTNQKEPQLLPAGLVGSFSSFRSLSRFPPPKEMIIPTLISRSLSRFTQSHLVVE
jgi:hypothetical protein